MSDAYTEYGIICDRTPMGLGYALLQTARTPDQAWTASREACNVKGDHYHRLKERVMVRGDWQDTFFDGMKEAQVICGDTGTKNGDESNE